MPVNSIRLKFDQISVLIAKDFKLKYDSTALGMLWSILIPLMMSGVYYFVFGKMMRWGDGKYALYLISGNFLWHYFSNVVNQSGGVMMSNAALLKKTAFDRRLLVWSTYFTESAHFILTLPVLLLIMLSFGVTPHPLTFVANVVVALVGLCYFSVGFGYMYAALNMRLRDLQRIMRILIMMWLYASPVFIPMSRVPEQYRWIYDVNPMALILRVWRDAFYEPAFHPELYWRIGVSAFLMFVVGRWIFKKNEPCFAEMM